MFDYNIYDLIIPLIVIFLSGQIILINTLPDARARFFVTTAKAVVFFVYFAFFFDGVWTFDDDVAYYNAGIQLVEDDFSLFTLFDPGTYLRLFVLSGGKHIAYFLINWFSIKVIGPFYFSPIVFNIILSYISAILLYRISFHIGVSKKSAGYIALFFLLHFELVAWISFLNLKDFTVIFLTLLFITGSIDIGEKKCIHGVLKILFSVYVLTFLRFYIPFFLIFSLIISWFMRIFLKRSGYDRLLVLFLVMIPVAGIVSAVFFKYQSVFVYLLHFKGNPIYGIFRFLLTPIPFNIQESYSFLFFGSCLNWLLFVFLLLGIGTVFIRLKKSYFLSFLLVYCFVLITFYGLNENLQGPRHRIQLIPFLILFQYIGLKSAIFRYFKLSENSFKNDGTCHS